ncbi:MAG: hypothetical protein QM504_06900 [Pseudomonadota bacterium]
MYAVLFVLGIILLSGITNSLMNRNDKSIVENDNDILNNSLGGTKALAMTTFGMPFLFPLLFLVFGIPINELLSHNSLLVGFLVFWPFSAFSLVWHFRLKNGKANPALY